jgi:hypothetical protein
MAPFSFTSTVLDEDTIFVFGSRICVANNSGVFNVHLADSRKPVASIANQCSDLDEFIDNLDELLLPDLDGEMEMMSVFYATSTHAAPGPLGSAQTDLRRRVLYSHSGYTILLRSTRRLHSLSPSLTWRRT